jgi:hypothetical protein
VTAIGHLHVSTATTSATIDVVATTTITLMTGDMITHSQRTAAMSAT